MGAPGPPAQLPQWGDSTWAPWAEVGSCCVLSTKAQRREGRGAFWTPDLDLAGCHRTAQPSRAGGSGSRQQ